MAEIQIEIVNRYGHGEQIGKNTHRIIFSEYEVRQQTETSNNACIPKHSWKDRLAVLSGRPHLNKPAGGKQGHPDVANNLSRINLDAKKVPNRDIEKITDIVKIIYQQFHMENLWPNNHPGHEPTNPNQIKNPTQGATIDRVFRASGLPGAVIDRNFRKTKSGSLE